TDHVVERARTHALGQRAQRKRVGIGRQEAGTAGVRGWLAGHVTSTRWGTDTIPSRLRRDRRRSVARGAAVVVANDVRRQFLLDAEPAVRLQIVDRVDVRGRAAAGSEIDDAVGLDMQEALARLQA